MPARRRRRRRACRFRRLGFQIAVARHFALLLSPPHVALLDIQ